MKKPPIDTIFTLLPALSVHELKTLLKVVGEELSERVYFKTRERIIQCVQDYRDTSKNAAGRKELNALLKHLKR